ncbi:hypothetical protein CLOP_g460, partial [Closterium sp. NIES-67]
LGHIVSTEGVKINPKKIKTIQEWKPPSNIKELQSFLGFVNYVRRFIPNMAGLSAPLTDRLKDHDCFWWGEKQQIAFDQLKIALTSPLVLRISDPDRPYEVITDASDIAIGAVLLPDFGDGLQPVAYESLQGAEKNYTVHDKEMLAIVHAFKTWRCYLTGADVIVRTDHKSLQYLRAQTNLNPRQIRWLDFLELNFHYTITHKRGANNITDALTRPTAHTAAILRAAGLLQPLDPPERPWQHFTMDYMSGLPAGPSRNNAILVVVDRLTKMAHFIACQQKITAEQTAQLFIANVIRLHGLPTAIISDRDPKFTSNFWHHLWDQFGTKLQLE